MIVNTLFRVNVYTLSKEIVYTLSRVIVYNLKADTALTGWCPRVCPYEKISPSNLRCRGHPPVVTRRYGKNVVTSRI